MTISDLKGLRACHSKIRSLQQRVERLRSALYSPSSPVLSHTPKGTDGSDPTQKAAFAIIDMEARLLAMIVDIEGRIEDVERWICTLPDDDQRLIRARYVDGMTWRQVARECSWSVDNCFKRHSKILKNL